MKKSRFTDGPIMAILKRAESGVPVTESCREEGIRSDKRRNNAPNRNLQPNPG